MTSPSQTGLLLAIDGDSLAHRAYHATAEIDPRRGRPPGQRARRLRQLPAAALGGRAARCGRSSAGTRSTSPTYRNEALPGYQAGRVFEDCDRRAARRSARARRVVRVRGREGRRLRGGRLPRRGCGRAGRGRCVVATSDRDAFQLVSDRVTVLQPVKGVSELARIGPGRGARALRRRSRPGAGLHRAARRLVRPDPRCARRRAEVGGERCSAQYGTLEAALAAGRFAPIADDLRLYRRIATMDAAAPAAAASRRRRRTGRAPRRTRASSG